MSAVLVQEPNNTYENEKNYAYYTAFHALCGN